MNRTYRLLLLALLVLVAAAAPSRADIVISGPLFYTVSQAGAGSTTSEATTNALAWIAADYPKCSIVSYTVTNPLCSTEPISGDPFCSVMVTARLFCRLTIPHL